MVLAFLVLYLTETKGYSGARAGFVLALYGVGGVVTAPLAGRWADRIGPPRLMLASLAASGVLYLLYPFAGGFPAVIGATLLLTMTAEASRPASLALLASLVPAERYKAAFSALRLAVQLGMSVGPAVGGFLATRSFTALFVVDGVTSLLAAALLLALPIHYHRPDAAPGETSLESAPSSGSSLPAQHNLRFVLFLASLLPVI